MIYLLDVNALVALGFINHEFHSRLASWVQSHNAPSLASCSITELGFVRVLAQAPAYGFTVTQARALLLRLKEAPRSRLTFISDEHDVSHLPGWVRAPKLEKQQPRSMNQMEKLQRLRKGENMRAALAMWVHETYRTISDHDNSACASQLFYTPTF